MQGVIAAVPTPIDKHGIPQKDLFIEHCRWALGNGCDGLNILGSTGEANSFDRDARMKVMQWAASELDTSRLMVGTGTPSLNETIALTKHADELGYKVALVLPPYYYKPVSNHGLISWYEQLHQALGDRAIAIYFYNFPQMTGISIPQAVIEKLHNAWPQRFAGIKDSSGDLDYCRALTKAMPDLSVFPSSETALGEAVQSGFAGCISATVNLTAPLCARAWAARKQANREMIAEIAELRTSISSVPLIPAVKYLVSSRTKNPDWQKVVPPFRELSGADKSALATVDQKLARNRSPIVGDTIITGLRNA